MTIIETREVNLSSGEDFIRPMTILELEQLKIQEDEVNSFESNRITKAAEKAVLLTKLGITDDEAKLLLS
jgi:predicted Ser/Thr protein kinase